VADVDGLPGLVTPELGEREPARDLDGVSVLSRDRDAGGEDGDRNGAEDGDQQVFRFQGRD
jgi:hypothetical protein